MNQKYKSDGCHVVVYDEVDREIKRVIESDIESTLKQENVIEALENIIQVQQKNLEASEINFKQKMITTRLFLFIEGILGIGIAIALTLLPFNVLMAIILAPVVSFVLTGTTIAIVSSISNRLEYKDSQKKILQKMIYCQNRKDREIKKLEQIKNKKSQHVNNVKKEKNLYDKDTIREIERDVLECSVSVAVPKKRVKSKKALSYH